MVETREVKIEWRITDPKARSSYPGETRTSSAQVLDPRAWGRAIAKPANAELLGWYRNRQMVSMHSCVNILEE